MQGATRTTFTYDDANQLTTLREGAAVTTYTYDQAGNLTLQRAGSARTTFTWDADNRLTQTQWMFGATPVSNTRAYNGDGQGLAWSEFGVASKLVWDNDNILLETDNGGTTVAKYTLEPPGYGLLLSQDRNGSAFHHFDALGSTDRITDDTQAELEHYLYEAFGKVLQGAAWQPFTWVGEVGYYRTAEIGTEDFYYIRARNYWPKLARWISRDLLKYLFDNFNLYTYASLRPLINVDPTGHASWRVPVTPADIAFCEADCAAKGKVTAGPTKTRYHYNLYICSFGTTALDCNCRDKPVNAGTCTAQELAYLQTAKGAACNGARKPRGTMSCEQLLSSSVKNTLCASTRQAIQDRCFKGKTDKIHQDLIDTHTEWAIVAFKNYVERGCPPPRR